LELKKPILSLKQLGPVRLKSLSEFMQDEAPPADRRRVGKLDVPIRMDASASTTGGRPGVPRRRKQSVSDRPTVVPVSAISLRESPSRDARHDRTGAHAMA